MARTRAHHDFRDESRAFVGRLEVELIDRTKEHDELKWTLFDKTGEVLDWRSFTFGRSAEDLGRIRVGVALDIAVDELLQEASPTSAPEPYVNQAASEWAHANLPALLLARQQIDTNLTMAASLD